MHSLPMIPFCVATLCAASLLSQQTIVSPQPASATVEGTASNAFPWITNIVCRYMQVHSDVGGSAKLITRIAHRRNGAGTPQAGTRAVDIDLTMGNSVAYDRVSYVFANNYIGTPTLVLPRQVVNIGPLVVAGSPAPFEMVIPLTTPFVYTGVTSLAWEVVQYSNIANGLTMTIDTESGSSTTGAVPLLTGTGCTATGRSAVMDLGIQHGDRGGTYQFGAYVTNAPANAPTLLYLGTSDPALTVPGLCGPINTNLTLLLGVAVADAAGYIRELAQTTTLDYPSALLTFVLPNSLGGANLFAQAHALDAGRPDPIQITNSNGRSWVVPMPNTTIVARASRLYNFTPQGPTHPHATPLSLAHGYTAVTEFTY